MSHHRGTPAGSAPGTRVPSKGRRANRRRALSQNFLTDPSVARWLVRLAAPRRDDLVIEVGPGDGALTRFLAPVCGRLLCYEIDPGFAARLAKRYRAVPSVRVISGDFLDSRTPRAPFSVVANIPYSITSDIVDWCLRAPTLTSATLITQVEYARKRTGGFGRWSRLTVRTWPWFEWTLAGRVPRDRFFPVPRVDAGVLRLRRRPVPLVPDHLAGAYRHFVDTGFSGVGGCLHASLRRDHPRRRLDAAFRAAGVDPRRVVAFVPPDRWVDLFLHLHGT
ncbi:ErmE/ErmH/ErmO/ErmR family 23S rRNA (adenine(2058)-N(6))-methyltransferase [Marinactinospora thermotolerans]|uniref:ErmE/ErmH/ErmO/ErmR family 23S rRNA (adenine(2058)-N(6))-methyltransferase n=1 Tax=Marinactinospora thermotolerans TaxID=531310 RepID=UPI003D94548E